MPRYNEVATPVSGDHVVGERFVKNGDLGVVLLYDKNGFIAGIQAGVSGFIAGIQAGVSSLLACVLSYLNVKITFYTEGHKFQCK